MLNRWDRRGFLKHVSVTGGLLTAHRALGDDVTSDTPDSEKHVTIVELFTSQGCSSCPPADRILADLVGRHDEEGLPVLGLSFHVDYWNYLGWSDPFSSSRWSKRQRLYASVLEDRVYTPQMIVGGDRGFVGSRRKQLDAILPEHFARPPQHQIKLETEIGSDREIKVSYEVTGEAESKIINVALVTRSLTATAARGENAGRTLTHANVVREFATRRLDKTENEFLFDLPAETKSSHAVIAYVQDIKKASITGAAEITVDG